MSELLSELVFAGAAAVRDASRKMRKPVRRSRGATLRPGTDTPLWNSLAAAALASTPKHGDKVNLGRYLGLPRQRVDEYLHGRSAPDAERTLLLLLWVQAKRRGVTLS